MTADQVIARFEFLPDRAPEFLEDEGRNFFEGSFDTVEEVVEYCEQFQDALIDVTALVNGRVITLSEQPQA